MKLNFIVLSLLVVFMVARTMATGPSTEDVPPSAIIALNQIK